MSNLAFVISSLARIACNLGATFWPRCDGLFAIEKFNSSISEIRAARRKLNENKHPGTALVDAEPALGNAVISTGGILRDFAARSQKVCVRDTRIGVRSAIPQSILIDAKQVSCCGFRLAK